MYNMDCAAWSFDGLLWTFFLSFFFIVFSLLPFTANKTHTWTNNNSQFGWILHSLLLVLLPVTVFVAVAYAHSTHTHTLTCKNYTNNFGLDFVYLLCTHIQSTLHYYTIRSHSHVLTILCRCVLAALATSFAYVCIWFFFLSVSSSLIRSLHLLVCTSVFLWITYPKQRYSEKHIEENEKSQAHKWGMNYSREPVNI